MRDFKPDQNASQKPKDTPTGNPDMGDKYEFNFGLYRIETLSEILKVCAKKYRKAIMKKDQKHVHDYQAMVNTLYTETFIYMSEETDFEEKNVKQNKEDILKNHLDDFSNLESQEQVMEKLANTREIYLEIRKLMKKVGLDIPQEETIGKTDVFT